MTSVGSIIFGSRHS